MNERLNHPHRAPGYSSGTGTWSSHNFYHADGNGNIMALVDSSGTLQASYRYDPYGNLLSSSGALADANCYRFSSKEWMATAGLYYYGYRCYSPNWQRWLNRDPIGENGGANVFQFCKHNPIGRIDRFGHVSGAVVVVGGVVVAGALLCVDAIACYAHMNDIRNKATGLANDTMHKLDPNYDEDENGPDHEGSTADALRHCIGGCMANQGPGACLFSSYVRSRIQARENGAGLNHDMDRANNQTGFGISGDCVQGCLNSLRNGSLRCYRPGDAQLSPCRPPKVGI